MKSYVITVLGPGGVTLASVDEGDKGVALLTARLASDVRFDTAVRGFKGATRVTEFDGKGGQKLVARYVMGERVGA